MVFFSLSEYTRTFIIKCSSSILQRTRHKSQETMENVNKAERIVEFFFLFLLFFLSFFFFLNLSFCSFIFFWYRSQVFLGRKIKRRKEVKIGVRKGNQKINNNNNNNNTVPLPQGKKWEEGARRLSCYPGVHSTPVGKGERGNTMEHGNKPKVYYHFSRGDCCCGKWSTPI